MASMKELKNRINSVKATKKITKAMQMVAVSELRRAQEAYNIASIYYNHINNMVAQVIDGEDVNDDVRLLLQGSKQDKVHLLIICTTERGLCGGFNSQILRFSQYHIEQFLKEGKEVKILVIGRKGYEVLSRHKFSSLIIDCVELSGKKTIEFSQANNIGKKVLSLFENGEFDRCSIIYSHFKSIIQQVPAIKDLIPLAPSFIMENQKDRQISLYEYEPTLYSILRSILPHYISVEIFKALLENLKGEMAAKVASMDNATRNASRMIDDLTLSYNYQRQVRITTELIEIISGAEAV
ncbi:ATP synthase gamma chain [Liberibacter crescens BT-1]|uniref:ATP synthase gamma chain n=1 Tax=Liberibacter crescens (strain BT-1) TaxID=1215343 RepID=L0EWE7_LIBCB|nr:F0F1 ATP synthase subunit gamma [Liberibacter crescens]AGA65170.1 ATP synthase gamma chain [Liberibacter crescens BT-1]AMC13128.1 ATP synthase F0F1 subunit gamma [Liberibacter crescens]